MSCQELNNRLAKFLFKNILKKLLKYLKTETFHIQLGTTIKNKTPHIPNNILQNYQRQLITKLIGIEEFSKLGPSEVIITERSTFDDIQSPTTKKKRKHKVNDQNERNIEPEILRENDFSILTNISLEERNNTNKNLQNNFEDQLLNESGENQLVSDNSDNVLEGHFTPSGLDHGGITPNHCIENIDSIPNLHVDQVSSILNASNVEQFSNMGFENEISSEKITHDWDGDYDYPQSSEQVSL